MAPTKPAPPRAGRAAALVLRTAPVMATLAFVFLGRSKEQVLVFAAAAGLTVALQIWGAWRLRSLAAVGEGLLLAAGLWVGLFGAELAFRTWPSLLPRRVLSDAPGGGTTLLTGSFWFDRPAEWGIRFRPLLDRRFCADLGDPAVLGTWGVLHIARTGSPTVTCTSMATDEDGFLNKPPVRGEFFDIVVAGDSFSMSTGNANWVARVGELTSRRTLNLGVPHWGTAQEVLAVRAYGLPKHPHQVVLAYFGGNDLGDAVTYERRRASGLSWRDLGFRQLRESKGSLVSPFLPLTGLLAQELKASLGSRLRGRRPAPVYPVCVKISGRPIRLAFYEPYVSTLTCTRSEIESSRNFRLVVAALRLLQGEARAAGVPVLVAYLPSKEQVYLPLILAEPSVAAVLQGFRRLGKGPSGELTPLSEPLDAGAVRHSMDDQARSMDHVVRDLGFDFLDLTDAFRQEAARGMELYNLVDTHWNDAGHELAARVVAAHLGRATERDTVPSSGPVDGRRQ